MIDAQQKKEIVKYFKSHTEKETVKKFNLTTSRNIYRWKKELEIKKSDIFEKDWNKGNNVITKTEHMKEELCKLAQTETDDSVKWNPENKVVQSHRDGEQYISATTVEMYIKNMLGKIKK